MAQRRRIGSIIPAGEGRWYVKVSRGKKPDGGKRVICETVEGTYEDADLRCRVIAAQMGAMPCDFTLDEYYWQVFRDGPSTRGRPRSNATLMEYDQQMRRNISPILGNVRLRDITHSMVKGCVLSASAPAKCKTTLRAVLRGAYNDGLTDEKHFDRRIVTPRPKKPQERPWDALEAMTALERLSGYVEPRIEAYAILGLSGFRCEEALGVSPADVTAQQVYDIATGGMLTSLTATITHTYTNADGFKPIAKNDFSMRQMPIIVQGRERLLAIIEESRPSDPSLIQAWATSRIVDLDYFGVRDRWNRACERLGLRRIPPDMLRHTSETLMQAAGLPDTLVSRLHGHTDLRTDYTHYMRPDIAAAEMAAQEVHRLLPETSGHKKIQN